MIKKNRPVGPVSKTEHDIAELRSIRLNELTTTIQQHLAQKNIYGAALNLLAIHNEKLYLDGGFKSCTDYGKRVLGYQSATVNNYLRIARNYIDAETGRTIFADGTKDIGYTQLIELLRVTPDEARVLFENEAFTLDSPARAVREAIEAYKAQQEKDRAMQEEADIEPVKTAYEDFHKAYNQLKELLKDNIEACELMQKIMDSMVVLHVECMKER